MNKRQKMNLDIVSRIDDEIIEKNTVKRARLIEGLGKKSSKRFIVLLAAMITLVALLASTLVVLLLPDGDDGQPTPPVEPVEKQVPIYQGMSVSDEIVNPKPVSATASSNISFLCATNTYDYRFDLLGSEQGAGNSHGNNGNGQGNNDDNGNHNGHNKKPAKDIVDENITITIPTQEMYTARPNQDIYITVHISNPDSFEIMSFTLNGKKYSSYMFEDGSDMENLILKVNVGEAEGLVEYTIDAIKYIDGTEIKDVIMDGDRTVQVGVYSEKQPAATITDVIIGINKMSFKVTVKDILGLLEITEGKLYAVLLDGETLIEKVELTAGKEHDIVFENLKTSTYYQYAIVACYDRFDGEGYGRYLLADKEFYTEGIMAFDSVDVGQESVSFEVVWNDDFENKTLASLSLYHGGTLIREIDTDATEIVNLLSNYEYTLVATYLNGDKTESTSLDFTTKSKQAPTLEVALDHIGYTSFSFKIMSVDKDGVGQISAIELLRGDEVVTALTDFDIREFTGLLTNNEYTVRVTYTYNLNDGVGEHTIVKTVDATTEAKATPEIAITENNKTQTSLGFDISVTDIDSVGAITKLELIHGEDVQNITDLSTREFTNLLSNNKYTVKVTYTYDLNDGVGSHTIEKAVNITTETKAEPVFTFKNMVSEIYSVSGEYDIANIDGTLISYKVELYKGDELVKENTDKEIAFDSLDYYTDYTVKINYTFDVNDGKGVQGKTEIYTVKTAPYVGVTECKFIGEIASSYNQDEVIRLRITLDNPTNVEISAVQINGKKCAVSTSASRNTVNVTITLDEDFDSGMVNITVEKIWMMDSEDNTIEYANKVEYVSGTTIFVNDTFEVLGLRIVNDSMEEIVCAFESDNVYAIITLNNPAGYTVDSVTLHRLGVNVSDVTITGWTRLDDNTYRAKLPSSNFGETITHTVRAITYSSPHSTTTLDELTDLNINAAYINIPDENIYYISTPEQLMAINGYGYYELTCDIDLSGLSWEVGSQMLGVFNGNGYSIKNMTFIGNATRGAGGLFSGASGYIHDLHMEGITYIATATSHFLYGGIASNANGLIMKNCSVDSTSYVEITAHNSVNGTIMDVGGVIGHTGSEKIEIYDCVNNGAVIVRNTSESVSADYIIGIGLGGIVGSRDIACSLYVVNCLNTGSVLLYDESSSMQILSVGGICACSVGSGKTIEIISCLNTGKVCAYSDDNMFVAFVSAIVPDYYNIQGPIASIVNCYCVEGQENRGALFVNAEQLSQKEFYTETLGWSEDIWDFSELDFENGKYPKLK